MQNDALGTKRRPVPLTSDENSKSFKTPHWHLHSLESGAWRIDPNRAGAAVELRWTSYPAYLVWKRPRPKWLRVYRVLAEHPSCLAVGRG